MEYKISETNENPKLATIEKRGVVVTFSFSEIEEQEVLLNKALKEIEAKSEYEKAKMINIEENHAFVKDMSEQDLFTAHMYQEAKAIVMVAGPKLVEIRKQLTDYAEEKLEIQSQIPGLAVVPQEEIEVVPEV